MYLSEAWLREYVTTSATREEIAAILTAVGHEVEETTLYPEDAVYTLKLTPNRGDCLSVRGMAYDVAAALGVRVRSSPSTLAPLGGMEVLSLSLEAGPACPRWVGRILQNISVENPTPVWMTQRLLRCGQQVSTLVDNIASYVMLELGQPLSVMDRDVLRGPLVVRWGKPGEMLTVRNGHSLVLDDTLLITTDADRPLALTGIMEGKETCVTSITQNIFLHGMHVTPAAIMGQARRLGLSTEAAYRYERGVDPNLPREAVEYATHLLLAYAGGTAGPSGSG